MLGSRTVVRSLALTLAFSFTAAPLTAMAADTPRLALKSSDVARWSFPMSAKAFRETFGDVYEKVSERYGDLAEKYKGAAESLGTEREDTGDVTGD